MKKLIGLLFVLLVTMSSNGQSTQRRYTSRMTPDGTIFFINPHRLGALTNMLRFEYDMTLLSWTDSVTVNFTFESLWMSGLENLKIVSGDIAYECNDFSVMFMDIKKNHYVVRITSKFSIPELSEILKVAMPPVFSFMQNGVSEMATYKEREWKKERKKLADIFYLYLYSKNNHL